MEIDKVFGIPAHPLIVHAPVVLIPLLLLAAVALVAKPAWRERGVPLLAITAAGVFVLCVLAAGSGEKLEARVGEGPLVEEHAELGEQLRLLSAFLAVAAVGWALALRRAALAVAAVPLMVATVALAGITTIWDVRTGHAGAKAVWKKAGDKNLGPAAARDDDD